jgi:hypothetical protein
MNGIIFNFLGEEISKRPLFQKALVLAIGEVTVENRDATYDAIGKLIADEYSLNVIPLQYYALDLNDYIQHLESLRPTYS